MSEKWMMIPEFDAYEVSDLGRVRRALGGTNGAQVGKILKPYDGGNGYLKVSLSVNGKVFKKSVHRLVLLAFKGLPSENQNDAAHWNGDRHDNRLSNLRWASRKENMSDTDRHGRTARGERNGHAKLNELDVLEIRKLNRIGVKCSFLAKRYGLSRRSISSICSYENWRHVP